jgi:hypothetical protein
MVRATTFAQLLILVTFLIAAAAWAPVRFAWPRWGLLLGLLGLGMTARIAQERMIRGQSRA